MKRTILLLATLLLACGAINAQNLVFHDVRDLVEDSNAPKFAIFTEIALKTNDNKMALPLISL